MDGVTQQNATLVVRAAACSLQQQANYLPSAVAICKLKRIEVAM